MPSQTRFTPHFLFLAGASRPKMKQIFITSFNQFKKALTYDAICAKIQPHREDILVSQ